MLLGYERASQLAKRLSIPTYTHVRQLLGYERLGASELVEPINALLAEWSLWKNLFCTTMEQLSATRKGSKQKRRHVKVPQTPAQRLLASGQLSQEQCGWIQERLKAKNPFAMKAEIEKRLVGVWKRRTQLLEAEKESEAGLAFSDFSTLRFEKSENAKNNTKSKRAMVSTLRGNGFAHPVAFRCPLVMRQQAQLGRS